VSRVQSIGDVPEQMGQPAAVRCERSVLSTFLVDPDALDLGLSILDDFDFSTESGRLLFRTSKAMRAAGEHVDPVTLGQRLLEAGKIEYVRMSDFLDPVPIGAGIFEDYCRGLKKQSNCRAAVTISENLRKLAYEGATTDELLSTLQRGVEQLTGRSHSASEMLRLDEVYQRDFGGDWDEFRGRTTRPAFPIPFAEPLGGLRQGELTLLAARPGEGKSAMAGQIAVCGALAGSRVHFWSLEMRSGSILRRLVASLAGISQWKLSNGRTDDSESRAAYGALSKLCELPILMFDRHAGTTVEKIRVSLRRANAKGECPSLVVIDYLQLLQTTGGTNRNEEIGRVSRALKGLTLDFPVSILALSQLSRDSEKEGKREPRLSDLRDSGSLEQDADNVAFLHPAGQDEINAKVREVRWIVRKQRNGHVGAVPLWFHRDQLRFTEAAS
jgi:replicative DNA helicase